MIAFPWITLLTTVPIVGALVLLVLGGRNKNLARWSALAFSFVALVLTLILWRTLIPRRAAFNFKRGTHGFLPWAWSITSESMALGCLCCYLVLLWFPSVWFASWQIKERVPLYYSLILILQACLFGTFTALNFFSLVHLLGTKFDTGFFPH